MAKETIDYPREERDDSYSDDSLFHIKSWGADLSFRELVQRYDDNELVKPELQRKYVWDKSEASRFIDSILLGLPVPSIFLAQTKDEKLLIIDGYQRIMTVRDFIKGIFSKDERVFKLSRSDKINQRWRGNAFSELDDAQQRKVKNTTIHAIIFVQQEPANNDTSLFQIFERINTSGRSLLPQEIRNCVAQGKLNSLLIELNNLLAWRSLFGAGEPDSRMRDIEFILRFFAIGSSTYKSDEREKISLKQFLDLFMKNNANPTDDVLANMKVRFERTVNYILNVFGSSAFHNISQTNPGKYIQKFSPTIFDSIALATDYMLGLNSHGVSPSEDKRRELLSDPSYKKAISTETMTKVSIQTRIQQACVHLYGIKYE